MFKQQMTEYQEKGTVEKPILSKEEVRDRAVSELSVENVEIVDANGDKQLQVKCHFKVSIYTLLGIPE